MLENRNTFFFRQFSVVHSKSTMKVGTDALVLGAWVPVLAEAKNILDIGTGSGVLALMMAQRTKAQILAIDIDKDSVDEAVGNFRKSPWHERLKARCCSLQEFSELSGSKFDFIISNPPFFQNSLLPADPRRKMAKHNTSLSLREFIICSNQLLSDDGELALILPVNDAKELLKLAGENQLYIQQTLIIYPAEHKPAHRMLLCIGRIKNPDLVSSDLIIRDSNGDYTKEYKKLTRDFHGEGHL